MTNVVTLPDQSRMQAALELIKRGFHVFPVHGVTPLHTCTCGSNCGRVGKHPRTQHGLKDASDSETDIRAWFKQWPDANIGIACGPSRLVVIDVDPRNDGDNGLVELVRAHGELPTTLTCNTGGGGQHYYYRVPDGVDRVRSHVPVQGVEIKAAGGYVIAPPSLHLLGVYVWDSGQAEEPAAAPFWLIDMPRRAGGESGPPVDGLMGQAFIAAGMNGPMLGPNKMAVQCPWEGDHSCGTRFDSSTIVFGPSGGGKLGWFHCSHAHCQSRAATAKELQRLVLDALPVDAVAEAKSRVRGGERAAEQLRPRSSWESSIKYTGKGDAAPEAGNLQIMLENMDEWRGCVVYDESYDKVFWRRQPPGIEGMRIPLEGEEVGDSAWVYVGHWFSIRRNVIFPKTVIQDVLVAAARARPINSLRDHLDSLVWDRVPRVKNWLPAICDCKNDAYSQFVGQAWLVSAVARAYQPGCQVDHTLVLEGKQGTGKTSVFRILGGDWYCSFSPTNLDKDARMLLHSGWIVEIAELAALQRGDMVRVKAFLTELDDRYRPPYGRFMVREPRRCVFGGTTNEDDYIRDSTGARRFWPIKCGQIDLEAAVRYRNQLWAEAIVLFRAGATWHPDRKQEGLLARLELEQESRVQVDPWEQIIKDQVARRTLQDPNDAFRTDELFNWVMVEPSKRDRTMQARISDIMRRIGYERLQVQNGNIRVWMWMRVA